MLTYLKYEKKNAQHQLEKKTNREKASKTFQKRKKQKQK